MSEEKDQLLFSNEIKPGGNAAKAPEAPAAEEAKDAVAAQEAPAEAPEAPVKKERKPRAAKKNEAAQAAQPADGKALPQDIFGQLLYIQQKLKVEKKNVNEEPGRQDSFAYRTLEDIYAELKPILARLGCVLTVPFVPQVCGPWVFATATAILVNAKGERFECTSSAAVNLGGSSNKYPAQEALSSGTMARKSAIAGLFLLDDTTKEQQEKLIPVDTDSSPRPGAKPSVPVSKGAQESSELGPENAASLAGPSLPQLVKDSPAWQKLGVMASSGFKGTKEELIRQLRLHYIVDDETANVFADTFYNG